ncbi:hypothetical protein [Nocardiopsis sp. LOL_012]|uniref:hypothetical protein n=1 Tax=Nocardiopsis sp. LOL_012 TaxID=3345409 RepID=UPI003A8BBFCD
MITSLSDRLLARIVPKAQASAANCWIVDCSRTTYKWCCITRVPGYGATMQCSACGR